MIGLVNGKLHLLSLNDELIGRIFSYLRMHDIHRIAATCKDLYYVANKAERRLLENYFSGSRFGSMPDSVWKKTLADQRKRYSSSRLFKTFRISIKDLQFTLNLKGIPMAWCASTLS